MTVDIANKLMTMRKEHGLSQEELADKLGVSRQSVGKWERAESSPDTDNLILLAQLYSVSIDTLLGTEPSDDNNELTANTSAHTGRGISFTYSMLGKDKSDKHGDITSGIVSSFIALAYLVLGIFGYWHPAWILFVTIPVIQFVVNAIVHRYSVARIFVKFPMAVLITVVYLCIGCFVGGWGTWWVLYVALPLYHSIVGIVFRKHATVSYRRYDKHGNQVAGYDKSCDDIITQDIEHVCDTQE